MPKRHPLDLLRARIWTYAARTRWRGFSDSSPASNYQLDGFLQSRSGEPYGDRAQRFDRYASGELPDRGVIGVAGGVVEFVEEMAPGTKYYFDNDLWIAAHPSRSQDDPKELERIARKYHVVKELISNANREVPWQQVRQPLGRIRGFSNVITKIRAYGGVEGLELLAGLIAGLRLASMERKPDRAFAFALTLYVLRNIAQQTDSVVKGSGVDLGKELSRNWCPEGLSDELQGAMFQPRDFGGAFRSKPFKVAQVVTAR